MTVMAKLRLLFCSACGLSVVVTSVPPSHPCEGCGGLAFSARQRVAAWADRLTLGDRKFLERNRIAAS